MTINHHCFSTVCAVHLLLSFLEPLTDTGHDVPHEREVHVRSSQPLVGVDERVLGFMALETDAGFFLCVWSVIV